MALFQTARQKNRSLASDSLDLRERVIETSRALLESEGVAALSMREVARQAGVTHQAPYHHFPDRESILAELVMRGFNDLAKRLAQANDIATTEGKRATVMASGRAYIGFALENPGIFRIMFRPDVCDPTRFPNVQAATARAYAELERLVNTVHGNNHHDSQALASLYWAHTHGLSCLMVDGPLGQHLKTRKARLEHLDRVGQQFVDMVFA